MKKWNEGDYSEHLSVVDYPPSLGPYAKRSYSELKKEQLELIKRG